MTTSGPPPAEPRIGMPDDDSVTFPPTPPPVAEDGKEALLAYFGYDHLPEHLQPVSRLFHGLAHRLHRELPDNSEKWFAIRQLLLAKDAAVRAAVPPR